jgi:parvulin-like peptidyl-prolyl isomerase
MERELLFDEAVRRGITVPREHIDKAWQAQLAQTQNVVKEREGKDLTEDDVLARLGFSSREEVLQNLERALITEKLRATIIRESDIKVTDDELRAEFDTVKGEYGLPARMHLHQIFINPDRIDGTKGEKAAKSQAKAEQAIQRLMSGQTFEGVARAMSDAPDAEKGGDMGMLPVSELPPFMTEAAARLKKGDISDVIKSEYGLHIIRLVDVEAPREANFEENARNVRARLLAQRGDDVVHEFCDKLVADGADVEVYLELEKNLILNGALPAG